MKITIHKQEEEEKRAKLSSSVHLLAPSKELTAARKVAHLRGAPSKKAKEYFRWNPTTSTFIPYTLPSTSRITLSSLKAQRRNQARRATSAEAPITLRPEILNILEREETQELLKQLKEKED